MKVLRLAKNICLTSQQCYQFSERPTSDLCSPYTRKLLSSKQYTDQAQIQRVITKTTSAYKLWKRKELNVRTELVRKFVAEVLADKDLLRDPIASETGKSYRDIDEQFRRVQVLVNQFITSGLKALQPHIVEVDEYKKGGRWLKSHVFEPIGISLLFPYYSQPIFDSMINLIPCLMSGNAALLKSSDFNHFLGPYLESKSKEVFKIDGLISQLFLSPEKLSFVAQFRSIKKVLYSGSSDSAKHIFDTMTRNRFIDCNLFFGGKDAVFVDASADLALAIREIVDNSFYNNGQSYDCVKRVYVVEEVEGQLVQLLRMQIQNIRLGNPTFTSTHLGPLCVSENAILAQQYVSESISEGAVCHTGGLIATDGNQPGVFFEPTLLSNCTGDMFIVQNQLHAPVLCVLTASIESMVGGLNDSQYGTGVRIFTRQVEKYKELQGRLEVGRVSFNTGALFRGNLPVEGWKKSGKGKLLSQLAFEQFSIPKSYNIKEL